MARWLRLWVCRLTGGHHVQHPVVLLTNGMVARLEGKEHLATSLHDGFEPENLLQLLHQHASGVMGPVGSSGGGRSEHFASKLLH